LGRKPSLQDAVAHLRRALPKEAAAQEAKGDAAQRVDVQGEGVGASSLLKGPSR
jgi:hypothetical protein